MLRKYSFRTVPDIFAPNPGFELAFAMLINLGTYNLKNTQLLRVGWASCPPIAKGGQDAHPTRLKNLFIGSPLSTLSAIAITTIAMPTQPSK
ncbi:MAG: hypothetical protein V7K32_11735 [Nostoc sp.]|uniref:hypothetical protein n=1 Tax=Nostoc sp. TaxID=1180 RepID=UPI002FFB9798